MPRANRHIVPGYVYHITHRCHDRKFLLRFQRDRNSYRKWLREAVGRNPVSVLGYCLTSNHVHLVLYGETVSAVSSTMQLAAGCTAGQYNGRKGRKGAFWEGRYHCTLVDSGEHLLNCLRYVDMNMVRATVVEHPMDWPWCSFCEIAGIRRRYRIIDRDCLAEKLGLENTSQLRTSYSTFIEKALVAQKSLRDPKWTESLAVGSESFVRKVVECLPQRQRIHMNQANDDGEPNEWHARETPPSYMRFQGGENRL